MAATLAATVAAPASTLIAVGGYGTAGVPPYTYSRFLTTVEEYHPIEDKWVTRPDCQAARYYLSAVGTAQGEPGAVCKGSWYQPAVSHMMATMTTTATGTQSSGPHNGTTTLDQLN